MTGTGTATATVTGLPFAARHSSHTLARHTHVLAAVRRTDGLANSRTGLGARSGGSDGGATTTLTAATTAFFGRLMVSTDKLELIDGEQ